MVANDFQSFNSSKTHMNEYAVTFADGETVEIEAWTPEAAEVIALEDAEFEGRSGLSVASVELLMARHVEL
jgi:hypothetical protein